MDGTGFAGDLAMRPASLLQPLCLIVALLTGTAAQAEMFKWVDEKGVTHYGDRIPPQYAKQKREVVNSQGDTIKVMQHEKTAAELAEDARQLELQKLQKEQARKDSFLLSTYQSEADLQKSRDEQLANLDGNIRISQIALDGTQKDLSSRQARATQLSKDGKPVPPDLTRQISELEKRLASDGKSLAGRQQERATIAARYERDIVRWRELRAASLGGLPDSTPNQGANTGVGK